MRLKSFSAASMAEAMKQVRQALGDNAIIVSTQGGDEVGSVRVTAAVETEDEIVLGCGDADGLDAVEVICDVLDRHRVPAPLSERLAHAAAGHIADRPLMALAAAFDAVFTFAPLPIGPAPRPLLLVGPPGGGKTVSIAKLAATAVIDQVPVRLITADTTRAGAIDQLDTFARALQLDVASAADPAALARMLASNGERFTLIDSPGVNPYDPVELSRLKALIEAAGAEPVLVLAAGIDALEAAEIGQTFAKLGVRRAMFTRLDAVRRLGGVLAAAAAGGFSLANASVTPHIANGLEPINPVALARLFLHQDPAARLAADSQEPQFSQDQVASL